jgi:hypothetical protein
LSGGVGGGADGLNGFSAAYPTRALEFRSGRVPRLAALSLLRVIRATQELYPTRRTAVVHDVVWDVLVAHLEHVLAASPTDLPDLAEAESYVHDLICALIPAALSAVSDKDESSVMTSIVDGDTKSFKDVPRRIGRVIWDNAHRMLTSIADCMYRCSFLSYYHDS